MELREMIKQRRIELGLTLEEVAKAVGVSGATVSRWETGNITKMRQDKIDLLANTLRVPPTYLMGWTDQNGNPIPSGEWNILTAGERPQNSEPAPALSNRNFRDIARELESVRQALESGKTLMFDGDPLSDEAKESIIAAMKLGMEAAKLKNKEKYTPKKYKGYDSE